MGGGEGEGGRERARQALRIEDFARPVLAVGAAVAVLLAEVSGGHAVTRVVT